MKNTRTKKKFKFLFLHVYGILDKKKGDLLKVSLNKEEIQLEIDLDNHDRNFALCEFSIKIKIPIDY